MDEVINVGMNRINKTPEAVKATANGSLKGNKKSKHASESVARFIFLYYSNSPYYSIYYE